MSIKHALLGATALRPGVMFMAVQSIEDMEARIGELTAAADAFRVRLEAGEDLTDDETGEIEANAGEIEKLTRGINARNRDRRKDAKHNKCTEYEEHARAQRLVFNNEARLPYE